MNARSSVGANDPQGARAHLGGFLKALREDAERVAGIPISLRTISSELAKSKIKVSTSRLDLWLHGKSAPAEHLPYLELINYLKKRGGRSRLDHGEWNRLIAEAMAEGRSARGGRPRSASRAAPVAPFRFFHTAEGDRPQALVGREAELDQLQETIRARSGYLALVAPPWAGKTAFLAAFVKTRAPDDSDLVAYFVRRGRGTDTAEDFLRTMVAELGRLVGRKPGRPNRPTLLALYEEAARASSTRGRNLLLVIDGLDEDARHRMDEQSIASLLPPQPYPGLCVLVSRRWYPPLPGDVPLDHPLRSAEPIPAFRPSPEAGVLRGAAMNDLATLFRAPEEWVREILGYLALASGGLSRRDLLDLISSGGRTRPPLPFDVQDLLHSVAGRVLGPEDLEPDTFVLAHEELYAAAAEGLGPDVLADLTGHLHTWADTYRADGWPAATPVYLLHHYQELLKGTGDLDRRAAFALDHRRLLRLADRGRTDLALASLDYITRATPTPTVLASAAASRSLLDRESRVVPREVLRDLVAVGDVARARSLALSPVDPASKAVRLMEVVQTLLTPRTPKREGQPAGLAREAAAWAELARQQNRLAATAEPDTAGIVARAAVALAASGLPDAAIRLLTTVDICRPDNVAAVAEAARLLLAHHPECAGGLLDELTCEAESHTQSEDGSPVFAVEIWSAVAMADPERAEPVHRRMKEFSQGLTAQSPGLAAVDCSAITATALANALPEEARELAETARHEIRKVLGTAPEDRLRESLVRVAQALLDVGETPEKVRTLLSDAPNGATSWTPLSPYGSPGEKDDGTETTQAAETAQAEEAEKLIEDTSRLSRLGDGPQVRQSLDRFTRKASAESAPVTWLPFLSQALPTAVDDSAVVSALMEPGLSDTPLLVRVLTSAALAHADAGQLHEARRYAAKAAGIAQRMTDPQPPEMRALTAQAFAHAGDFEQAGRWAAPPGGRRPLGKAGTLYRRATLAIEAGREPETLVARAGTNDLSRIGMNASGADVRKALCGHAAGARTDALVASLETAARARRDTEPLITTGLALLHAVLGDTERACGTAAELPDPAARGVAQATVAAFLAGVPVHLDVAGDEDRWTLSVLRVLAHRMYPQGAGDAAAVQHLILETLDTSSWYWALPVLSHTEPEATYGVVDVLNQQRQIRRTGS